jgi:hypothetical protein
MIFGNLCKCLRGQRSRLLSSLLVRDRNRRLIGVAGKRLRWLSPSAIEQCIRPAMRAREVSPSLISLTKRSIASAV